MSNAVKLISVGRGFDPRDFALVVFGGAGPLHGAHLARELDIPTVVFPRHPGIASAMGCLLVDIRHDLSLMYLANCRSVDLDGLETSFRELEREAEHRLRDENVPADAMRFTRHLEMCYAGQWRALSVALDAGRIDALDAILERFHRERRRAYAFSDPARDVEIYSLRLVATGAVPKPEPTPSTARGDAASALVGRRRIYFEETGAFVDASKDGSNATSPVFGVGLAVQSIEAQERLNPVLTTHHRIVTDSGGPGKFRGGCGLEKGGALTQVDRAVISYCCDRARSVTWGIEGGLPSNPHGVYLERDGETRFLGAVFSSVPVRTGDRFNRPSAGGGGIGDPLDPDPARVLEDPVDGYVSVGGARRDYGVVVEAVDPELDDYRVDAAATARVRDGIRRGREAWLAADPETVAARLRAGEITPLEAIRRHGVVSDWGTGTLLPKTTAQFRAALARRRSVARSAAD